MIRMAVSIVVPVRSASSCRLSTRGMKTPPRFLTAELMWRASRNSLSKLGLQCVRGSSSARRVVNSTSRSDRLLRRRARERRVAFEQGEEDCPGDEQARRRLELVERHALAGLAATSAAYASISRPAMTGVIHGQGGELRLPRAERRTLQISRPAGAHAEERAVTGRLFSVKRRVRSGPSTAPCRACAL